ncbi:uncharacterized protein LOC114535732 [Dendronephthya gigantea]|uniref:uncharacterized protein LOC114535732 n=1 Tax=Dendronephthya gigantea TaxID=151771 RepID=UPI00106C2D16|nr:uncharacterized protein LOC114535732 [Dendronephthya gigantea]
MMTENFKCIKRCQWGTGTKMIFLKKKNVFVLELTKAVLTDIAVKEIPVKQPASLVMTLMIPQQMLQLLLRHLNGVFRQRINSEIENFRVNINDIVDDQQMNFRSMFNLQPDIGPAQEVPMHLYSPNTENIASDYQVVVDNGKQNEQMSVTESPASTFNSFAASESDQGYSSFPPNHVKSQRDIENTLVDKYLLRLMTAILLIGNTLRREEYRVF